MLDLNQNDNYCRSSFNGLSINRKGFGINRTNQNVSVKVVQQISCDDSSKFDLGARVKSDAGAAVSKAQMNIVLLKLDDVVEESPLFGHLTELDIIGLLLIQNNS